MKLTFTATLEKAIQFHVELPTPVSAYADHFLQIVNNAREYPNVFYKVENNHRNTVYVTIDAGYRETVKDFLEYHGTITAEYNVYVCRPELLYNKKINDYLDSILTDDVWEIVGLAPFID